LTCISCEADRANVSANCTINEECINPVQCVEEILLGRYFIFISFSISVHFVIVIQIKSFYGLTLYDILLLLAKPFHIKADSTLLLIVILQILSVN
jgi:hypothetical protein